MPGSDMAIFLNKLFTLCPAFADVSMNIMFSSLAFAVASSSVTWLRSSQQCCDFLHGMRMAHRLSDKSALLPTKTIMTSFPRSERTSSIHLEVDKNDVRSRNMQKSEVFLLYPP